MIMKRSTEFLVLAIGLLLICFGSLLNFFSQDLLQDFIRQQFILSETSYFEPYWRKNPIKIRHRLYFFNWTNPSDLKDPGYKPKFEEVGPYSFEENIEKVNVVWNDNGTVSYRKVRTWFYRPEDSNGSLKDIVNTLNPIAVSAIHFIRYWSSFAKISMTTPFRGTQRMYVTRTVAEVTFEGYPDPLLDAGSIVPGMGHLVPQDKAGYLYGRNGTSSTDGVFNVETGVRGIEKIGKVNTWNYRNVTDYYDTPCGYLVFKYNRTVTIHGIDGYRYEPAPESFDNGTSYLENQCFCSGECVPSGALNVSGCRFGAPAFASWPHFFTANSSYRYAIEGMKPDPEKHQTYIVLEPTYGILLDIAARLQINMMVQPDPDIRMFAGIPRLFLPIFWLEQTTTLSPHLTTYVKIALALPTVAYVISIILLVTGIIFLLLFVISWIRPRCKKFIMGVNLSFDDNNQLATVIEKEVKDLLIGSKPTPEILPVIKESDM